MDGAEPDGTCKDCPNVYDGARGVHFIEKTMEGDRSTEKWTRASWRSWPVRPHGCPGVRVAECSVLLDPHVRDG